jgi:glycosyltransferase involved in cell wall biosynthesis
MESLIDLVGHFGTTFSYATVASNVARGLRDAGLLGQVLNLDPQWHDSYSDLRRDPAVAGSHVLLFTLAHHYMDAFSIRYGRDKSAIFVSPNTDTLDAEYAETCEKFGLVFVPSRWCESVVQRAVKQTDCALLPLGVESIYLRNRLPMWRRNPESPIRMLHFSTDQMWPSRKGTEELFFAFADLLEHEAGTVLILRAHLPRALLLEATRLVRSLEIEQRVELVVAPERGADHAELALEMFSADMVVAPSRCEGYGMMLQAALVAGIPLVCTYNTGHCDFLREFDGWVGVPTFDWAPIFGEGGMAPVVERRALVQTLRLARAALPVMHDAAYRRRGEITRDESVLKHSREYQSTWPVVQLQWVERIREWMES